MPPAAHAHLPDGGEQGGVVGREREGRVLVRRSGARALGGKLQRERLDAAGTPNLGVRHRQLQQVQAQRPSAKSPGARHKLPAATGD